MYEQLEFELPNEINNQSFESLLTSKLVSLVNKRIDNNGVYNKSMNEALEILEYVSFNLESISIKNEYMIRNFIRFYNEILKKEGTFNPRTWNQRFGFYNSILSLKKETKLRLQKNNELLQVLIEKVYKKKI